MAARPNNAIGATLRERKARRRFELEIGDQVIFVYNHDVGVSCGEKRGKAWSLFSRATSHVGGAQASEAAADDGAVECDQLNGITRQKVAAYAHDPHR